MQKKHYSVWGGMLISLAAILLQAQIAFAVTIKPPTFDYTLNPGDTQLDVVTVVNEGDIPLTLYPTVYNFTATEGDETGAPQIYPPSEDREGTALAPWITLDRTAFTIPPGQQKNVSFAINVPGKDLAQPGGHYGVVIFGTEPPSDDLDTSHVSLATQLGALVLVRVNGDLTEQASISEFGLKEKKAWYQSRPINMYVRVENTGNTHLRPTGNVFVKNMFGRQVAEPKVNNEFKSVLPHSIRKFEFSWNGTGAETPEGFFPQVMHELRNFAFGRYTAEAYLTYGSKGHILSAVKTFTVWPWHLMIVVGIGLAVIIVILALWMRSHNNAIIRRYERSRR